MNYLFSSWETGKAWCFEKAIEGAAPASPKEEPSLINSSWSLPFDGQGILSISNGLFLNIYKKTPILLSKFSLVLSVIFSKRSRYMENRSDFIRKMSKFLNPTNSKEISQVITHVITYNFLHRFFFFWNQTDQCYKNLCSWQLLTLAFPYWILTFFSSFIVSSPSISDNFLSKHYFAWIPYP